MGDLPQPALIDEPISTFMMLKGTFSPHSASNQEATRHPVQTDECAAVPPRTIAVSALKVMAVRPNYVRAAQCILLRQISTMVIDGIVQIDRNDYQ